MVDQRNLYWRKSVNKESVNKKIRVFADLDRHFFIFDVIGWGLNIIKIFGASTINGEVIVRGIGVFVAPFGAVLGYF